MKRIQNAFSWVVVASEVSHVFCCVLPSVFTVISVLIGMGMIGVMPLWIETIHHTMHEWELPIIITSGVVLILGWAIHVISQKLDCHDTGCAHGSCKPKKNRASKVLKIATFLFLMNIAIYFSIHYGQGQTDSNQPVAEHHHHGHSH
ncbi:MAG: hypothetical protein ACRBDL_03640 [Alphaproteobacteria bacterium]